MREEIYIRHVNTLIKQRNQRWAWADQWGQRSVHEVVRDAGVEVIQSSSPAPSVWLLLLFLNLVPVWFLHLVDYSDIRFLPTTVPSGTMLEPCLVCVCRWTVNSCYLTGDSCFCCDAFKISTKDTCDVFRDYHSYLCVYTNKKVPGGHVHSGSCSPLDLNGRIKAVFCYLLWHVHNVVLGASRCFWLLLEQQHFLGIFGHFRILRNSGVGWDDFLISCWVQVRASSTETFTFGLKTWHIILYFRGIFRECQQTFQTQSQIIIW